MFVIKVWVAKDGQEFQLAIERLIDLRKLAYLGTLVSVNYITYMACECTIHTHVVVQNLAISLNVCSLGYSVKLKWILTCDTSLLARNC